MSQRSDNAQMTGMFRLSGKRRLPGTLSLDGSKTTLHLWDEAGVLLNDDACDETITGVLGDQKLVTLLGCILNNQRTNFGRSGTATHHYIFPHHVVIGDRLVSEDDADIENISYVFEDVSQLFHDIESFQVETGNDEKIKAVIQSLDPSTEIHEAACVAYYTGKSEIFSSDTELGCISVRHSPTFGFGGPEGIRIDNGIVTTINFSTPLGFQEALSRMHRSVSFFELMVGRVQNLKDISIRWKGDDLPISCDVYRTMYPRYDHSTRGVRSSFQDVLVHGATDATLLSGVASAWLQRDASWRTARTMLRSGWEDIRSYSADRLVRAANMYDLLPETCFPDVPPLDRDLAVSVQNAKEMFRELPYSTDRNSVLGALGRVGALTLKRKIRFRVEVILRLIRDRVPNIDRVAEEAVNMRNHFVHGSATRIDYIDNSKLGIFLTDTLEFVFAASDLVDAGWDIGDWVKRGPHPHHPFGRYLEDYTENWNELKRLIDAR